MSEQEHVDFANRCHKAILKAAHFHGMNQYELLKEIENTEKMDYMLTAQDNIDMKQETLQDKIDHYEQKLQDVDKLKQRFVQSSKQT